MAVSLPFSFSQDFYGALFDASPDCMVYKDADGVYRLVNTAFLKLMGLSRETLLGRTDNAVFPPENARHQRETDLQVLRAGQTITFEYEVVHAGRSVWLQVQKNPVRDPDGRIVGIFAIARNITIRKQSDADGQLARDALEQRVADRTRRLRQVNDRLRREIKQRHQAETALAD